MDKDVELEVRNDVVASWLPECTKQHFIARCTLLVQAFGPPQSANRSAEVARRLAAGGRVSKVNEARTLQFLTESFKSALDTYPTSLRDDVELLRASRQVGDSIMNWQGAEAAQVNRCREWPVSACSTRT